MMKYIGKYWIMLAPLVRRSLKWHYGKDFAEQVMKKAKPIYRDLLNRMYDIGADNPMASNVYTSFVFIAVWKAAEGKITVKALREISKEVIQFKPLKLINVINLKQLLNGKENVWNA